LLKTEPSSIAKNAIVLDAQAAYLLEIRVIERTELTQLLRIGRGCR